MNRREFKKFVQKTRAELKRVAPAIYEGCFAHLSDAELISELRRSAVQLASLTPGETLTFVVQFPDCQTMECGEVTKVNPTNN